LRECSGKGGSNGCEARRFESKGFKFKCAFLHSGKQKLLGIHDIGEIKVMGIR
jgi:hypothetical protein